MIFALSLLLFLANPPKPMSTPEPPLAGEALKVPESVKASPGDLVIVRAESACKRAIWILPPGLKADPNEGGLKLTLVAPPAGSYVLFCVVAPAADQVSVGKVILQVGTVPDVKPIPPNPPDPPADPFVADLKRLYAAEPNSPKKEIASKLAAVYRLAVEGSANKSLETVADLMELIDDAASQLAADRLLTVRTRVVAELKKLGSIDSPLTPELRDSIASVYDRAAKTLEEVSK